MSERDKQEHVLLLVWRGDPRLGDYGPVLHSLPPTWDVLLTKERLCGEKLNHVFNSFPDEAFYGFLADDVALGTTGMLHELKMEALNGRFAWPNDGVHGPRMATHPCAPGKMLRALGFWAHPLFPHNGMDTVLYRVSEALGISKYRSDLHLIHFHPFTKNVGEFVKEEWDDTYEDARELNMKAIDDMYRFQVAELPKLIKQVESVYAQKVSQ